MSKRHEKLGIKQTIQKEWMDRTLRMVLAGMTEKEIRQDLDQYLSTQRQSGGIGERGQKTYGMAIGYLPHGLLRKMIFAGFGMKR